MPIYIYVCMYICVYIFTSAPNLNSNLNPETTLPSYLHLDLQASRFTMPSTDHNDHRSTLSPAGCWVS